MSAVGPLKRRRGPEQNLLADADRPRPTTMTLCCVSAFEVGEVGERTLVERDPRGLYAPARGGIPASTPGSHGRVGPNRPRRRPAAALVA